MKNIVLIVVLFLVNTTIKSQERFFEFLPGWRNIKIVENGNKYISIGLTSDGIGLNHYKFSLFSQTGLVNDEWEFDLDTALSLESRYTNDISPLGQEYFVSGSFTGIESERHYGTLFRFNENLNDTLWAVSYNILPGNGTIIRSHLAINSNKFILGGFLQNTDFQVYSALMQTDSLGNIAWRKNFFCGNDCELFPNHIMQAADGGYFFTCAEVHFDNTASVIAEKTAIIKTDSLGNQQYRLHPGQPDLYAVRGWVLPTDDGNYITAYSDPFLGVLDENPQINDDATLWINSFDIEGNLIYDINLLDYLPKTASQRGFHYYIMQMIKASDGNIIIVGFKRGEEEMGFILKITQDGSPIWYRFYSPPQSEGNDAGGEFTRVYGVTQTSDGGYIMAGEFFSSPGNIYPEGIQTAIAVKVDEFGCLEPGCQLADAVPEIAKADLGLQVYPNPASETVNISVAENVKVEKVRVYGVMGRVVLENQMNENKMKMDVSDLLPGIYLIEVVTKDRYKEIQRLIISKY